MELLVTPMPETAPKDPRHVLKTVFGYDTFRPKQEEIVHRILREFPPAFRTMVVDHK